MGPSSGASSGHSCSRGGGRPSAGELKVRRVFGPEVPTGPYKHPACMTELENGDLYLVYYGGAGEYATETGVFGSRLKKGEAEWSPPEVVARDPFRSVGNAVVWQAPDGLVWLFYVVRYGNTWSTSRIQFKVSTDDARTWSDASLLALEEGMMVRNRPIVLNDGDYLLPIYHETGNDTESVGPDSTSLFLRFDPKDEDVDRVRPHPVGEGEHPARPRPAQRRRPDRLLPSRRRLRPEDDRLPRALRVARRRPDLERGEGLGLPEPQRGDRLPQAQERQPAAGLQRQHGRPDPVDRGPLTDGDRSCPLGATSAKAGELRLPDRLPGRGRHDPRRLHVGTQDA